MGSLFTKLVIHLCDIHMSRGDSYNSQQGTTANGAKEIITSVDAWRPAAKNIISCPHYYYSSVPCVSTLNTSFSRLVSPMHPISPFQPCKAQRPHAQTAKECKGPTNAHDIYEHLDKGGATTSEESTDNTVRCLCGRRQFWMNIYQKSSAHLFHKDVSLGARLVARME